MKKYSKTKHHELNELNITPLLDLCFVLLVIFILTTAPPVNTMDVALPTAGDNPKDPTKKPFYVEINNEGKIRLNAELMKNEDQLLEELVKFRKESPDLNVVVRADNSLEIQRLVNVLDVLISARVDKFGLATEARTPGR
ncbi:MAG: ExbD/TolR family protein [Gammaproteobacteria bacterium]